MNDINKTIKHFESLQKRYTTQHNGQMCERVTDALEALYHYKSQTGEDDRFTPEQVRKMTREEIRDNYKKIIESMKYWN